MKFAVVVLAGQRPGRPHPVALAAGVQFAVLAPIAGEPMLAHVLRALNASGCIEGGYIVCAPAVLIEGGEVAALAAAVGIRQLDGAQGPSASAALGVRAAGQYPSLITTGDHPLLDGDSIRAFCTAVEASADDFLLAYVRHADVQARLPATKRTRIAFADGGICGCNLFAVRTARGLGALLLWQRIEAERKRPWRVVRMLGPVALLRYLVGRLTFAAALARLSELAGCRIGALQLTRPELAVDVDSVADWLLVQQLFVSARSA